MNAPEFYRVDSRKIHVVEYWRWFGFSSKLWKAILLKLADQALPNSYWPHPSRTQVVERPSDDDLGAGITKLVREAEQEGFVPVLYTTNPTLSNTTTLGANMVSGDRTTLGLCLGARNVGAVTRVATLFSCMSRTTDGRLLGTTNAAPAVPQSPVFDTERLVGASVHDVVARHRRRIAGKQLEPYDVSPEKVLQEVIALAGRSTTYLLTRGILMPMSAAEIEEVRSRRTNPPT